MNNSHMKKYQITRWITPSIILLPLFNNKFKNSHNNKCRFSKRSFKKYHIIFKDKCSWLESLKNKKPVV